MPGVFQTHDTMRDGMWRLSRHVAVFLVLPMWLTVINWCLRYLINDRQQKKFCQKIFPKDLLLVYIYVIYLVAFLARVSGEQVFFQQFSLTSFNCSCVQLNKFSWKESLAQTANFSLTIASMTSFWTRLLVKEKLVNLCRTHEQINLVKENLVVWCTPDYSHCTGLIFVLSAQDRYVLQKYDLMSKMVFVQL